MTVKFLIAIMLATLAVLNTGCGEPAETGEPVGEEKTFQRIDGDYPGEVEEWVEASRLELGGRTLVHDGRLYLLVTYGEQMTGGYSVKITGVTEKEGLLVVEAKFAEPGEGDIVTQALTYPYDLVYMEETDLPVEFRASGALDSLPFIEE